VWSFCLDLPCQTVCSGLWGGLSCRYGVVCVVCLLPLNVNVIDGLEVVWTVLKPC